jgi:hypothetical protein
VTCRQYGRAPGQAQSALPISRCFVWASCRFYDFLFYVLERYVDPTLRYARVAALLAALRRRRWDASGR